MHKKRAFTLVELLVVIAIIAMLVAILIPALSAARKQAEGTACMANQRGLITAYIAYAHDNDDYLACADTMAPSDYIDFAWAKPPSPHGGGQQVTMENRLRAIEKGVLFPYCENVESYHCPGDHRYKRGTNLGSNSAYTMYRSYGIQGGLFGEEITRKWSGFAVMRLSDVRSQSTTYVFVEEYYDGEGANFNGGSWQLDKNNNGESWWNIMAVWHVDSYTLSFADGHAEKRRCKDKRTIKFSKERVEADYTQEDNPDLEFMIDGYAVPLPRAKGRSW